MLPLRSHALQIWHAAVDAARPYSAIRAALTDPHHALPGVLASARRILVAGAGKAGLAMSQAVEETLDFGHGNLPADWPYSPSW